MHGAAGWQMNVHALRLTQVAGLRLLLRRARHASASAGVERRADPLPAVADDAADARRADRPRRRHRGQRRRRAAGARPRRRQRRTLPSHVFTLHAELEGMKLAPVLEQLLDGWKAQGYRLVVDASACTKRCEPLALPRCEVGPGPGAGPQRHACCARAAEFLRRRRSGPRRVASIPWLHSAQPAGASHARNRKVADFSCAVDRAATFTLSEHTRPPGRPLLLSQGQHAGLHDRGQPSSATCTRQFAQAPARSSSASRATASSRTRASRRRWRFRSSCSPIADEKLCAQFGVIKMKNMYGRQVRGIERSTFVIDGKGTLAREWRGVKVPGHARRCSRPSRRSSGSAAPPRRRKRRPLCPSHHNGCGRHATAATIACVSGASCSTMGPVTTA